MPISPLAPTAFPDLPVIRGVRFAAAQAGVKYQNRDDVMLAVLDAGSAIAGVFTTSKTRAASVLDCEAKIGKTSGAPAAILVNSGNANAFTGKAGFDSVDRLTAKIATATQVPQDRVFTSSTGVIGEALPDDRIADQLTTLTENLSDNALPDVARAIMTTDTFPTVSYTHLTLPTICSV